MRHSTPRRMTRRSGRPGPPKILLAAFCLLMGLAFVLCGSQAGAAEKAPKDAAKSGDSSGGGSKKIGKSDAPFNITSDRMEAYQKDRVIVFDGHVVVRQDDLVITGAKMKVIGAELDKSKEKKPDDDTMMKKIDRIEIEGDVKITQREKIATSDKAIFYHQEQKVVLIGNPMVSQGQDMVRGRLITLYLEQGKSVVEGGEQNPVQAVLHPAKKE